MFIKKNGAVISVIVLLLFMAVYLNWQYGRVDTNVLSDLGPESGVENVEGVTDVSANSDEERLSDMQYTIELRDGDSAAGADGTIETGLRAGELSAYFDETRLGRQQTRDQAIDLLRSTLESKDTLSEEKTAAEESITTLATNAVAESRIESLIMAKGFTECVAMIDDTGVNVVVLPKEEGLQASDVSKIKDIIISQTSVTADQIRVIEAK